MNKPCRIYKYEPFTSQSLQNLKAQSIYFGSPLGFNDPYDCALKAGIEDPSDHDIKKIREHYLGNTDLPISARNEFETKSIEDLKKIIIKGARSALKIQSESFLKNNGVSCFTERNDDLLMWSHYGGRYKGFCLEFNTEHEPFTKLRKVTYTKEMPQISAAKMLIHGDYDQILKLFCTKSDAWWYEKEWRSIHKEAGTLFTYEAQALKSVYLGPDMDRQSMEIICLILSGQNPEVEFWRGYRSEEKFEVYFEKFTYTSHIDAKNQGLIT